MSVPDIAYRSRRTTAGTLPAPSRSAPSSPSSPPTPHPSPPFSPVSPGLRNAAVCSEAGRSHPSRPSPTCRRLTPQRAPSVLDMAYRARRPIGLVPPSATEWFASVPSSHKTWYRHSAG
eukprot:3424847-Rhodomonas_salina.1